MPSLPITLAPFSQKEIVLRLTPRRQQVFDWYGENWELLAGQGIEEEALQGLFRGKTNIGNLRYQGGHSWAETLLKKARDLRPQWRKTINDILEMIYEVGLYYYQHLREPDLPEPQPLPGTPAHKKNGQPSLKHSKDTLKLGERLLTSKYQSLRRDIEAKFTAGKLALDTKVLEAVEKSKSPAAKAIKKKSDEIEAKKRKADECLAQYRELETEMLKLRDQQGQLDDSKNDLDSHIRCEQVELRTMQETHKQQIRAKFKEAEAALNLEQQRLIRDLDLQRELEIDRMWSDHLPPSVRSALARVPELTSITGGLPTMVRALISSES